MYKRQIYPGIPHGKWAIETESFGENTPAMVAVVGLDLSLIHISLLKEIPLQAALVLNNGVPSYLLDQYNPGKKSRIYQLITDDKLSLIHI